MKLRSEIECIELLEFFSRAGMRPLHNLELSTAAYQLKAEGFIGPVGLLVHVARIPIVGRITVYFP
jgi:hypothetical protein